MLSTGGGGKDGMASLKLFLQAGDQEPAADVLFPRYGTRQAIRKFCVGRSTRYKRVCGQSGAVRRAAVVLRDFNANADVTGM